VGCQGKGGGGVQSRCRLGPDQVQAGSMLGPARIQAGLGLGADYVQTGCQLGPKDLARSRLGLVRVYCVFEPSRATGNERGEAVRFLNGWCPVHRCHSGHSLRHTSGSIPALTQAMCRQMCIQDCAVKARAHCTKEALLDQ